VERLDLVCGATPRLFRLQWVLFVIAAVCLLASASSWPWTAAALSALVAVHLSARACLASKQPHGRLVLRDDGNLELERNGASTPGTLLQRAWISRWLCVITWENLETGTRHPCLVCASRNTADEFRRLLVRLRLGQVA